MTTEEALRLLRADVAALGGQVDTVLMQHVWSYFPHVSPADADAGFYQELESLQGKMATYYINSLASFEDVEHAASYAKALVQKQFVISPSQG